MSDFTDGLYFESKVFKVGTAGTSSSSSNDVHYFCKGLPNGNIALEMCKNDGTSTGFKVEELSLDSFKERFKDCSQHECHLNMTEEDKQQEAANKVSAIAQKHLDRKEYFSAEFEFKNALKLDEENVRAHYGLGKTYLEQGKKEEAEELFVKLSEIDALFDKENKHIFNEMGIDLRKMELFDDAIKNYDKAISIDPEDHALYYNMGRAHKEKGDLKKAKEYIEKSIKIKPDFEQGKKYLAGLESLMNKG